MQFGVVVVGGGGGGGLILIIGIYDEILFKSSPMYLIA